ncbi:MAG: alpha amylase C-terminal domain-containing protein [Fibrobacterota bacterium]
MNKKNEPLLIRQDPLLAPYRDVIQQRMDRVQSRIMEFTSGGKTCLKDMALGHLYYGLHREKDRWVAREWVPNATELFLTGDFSNWEIRGQFRFQNIGNGNWELSLPMNAIHHRDCYRLFIKWNNGEGFRLSAWAQSTLQDPSNLVFNAHVWSPKTSYAWQHPRPETPLFFPFIYEAHVGMSGEEARVATYREFTERVLPRVARAGYNTVQLMAVMEHPYYASFGYQVSNFFAPASRSGTPDDLKELVDAAHGLGLRVIMDLVHSHAVKNEIEGLAKYDGTQHQFFHEGAQGNHPAWDSKCFDYNKPAVLHFLLSNCRYWLETFRFDGFRFDGVTSMLYHDHGLARNFTHYDHYYDNGHDEAALVYLSLANRVIHEVNPLAITIAEEMSGMPGLAAPLEAGGMGFDYRLAMGTPDYWIKTLKERPDEEWDMGGLFHELTNRRKEEKTIGYAESHDQAIVGDKTLAFRLMDRAIYTDMHIRHPNPVIDRGMALHKMIRLVTLATAGNGYLNFMGNEFGHPEWIDFPREGNGWSYAYARRQWSLVDNPELRYRFLAEFDRDMIALLNARVTTEGEIGFVTLHNGDKVIAFRRYGLYFIFNFSPSQSFPDYGLQAEAGKYQIVLDSDSVEYGGHGRVDNALVYGVERSKEPGSPAYLKLYLPCRTALVLAPLSSFPCPRPAAR